MPTRLFSLLIVLSTSIVQCTSSKCIYSIPNELSLPYIDLSRDTSRQFVVARSGGVYYGHPTTVSVADATGSDQILATYPVGGHARGRAAISVSSDGGRQWSKLPGDSTLGLIREVPTIHKLKDKTGRVRLLIFTGLYPVRMSISEDNGSTWTPFRTVGDWGGIVTMSDLIPVKNHPADEQYIPGKYLAFFHDDGRFINGSNKAYNNPKKFILYKSETVDGGLTWSAPEIIREDTTHLICEPGLVRSPDGKELAMLLRENSRRHNSQVMFSTDEGKTWSQPKPLHPALTGDRHVLRYDPDGRLVVVFRDYQPSKSTGPTEGDFVAWVGQYEDIKKGLPGQYRVRLLDNYAGYDAGYAGLELLKDGTFLATTYLQYRPEDRGNNSVVAVRFHLRETDKAARLKNDY